MLKFIPLLLHLLNYAISTEISDLLPKNYSRAYSSAFWDHVTDGVLEPNPISVSIQPYMITELSLRTMEFKIELNIMIKWIDSRLNQKSSPFHNFDPYQLPRDINILLWHPEIVFRNCKGCSQQLIDPIQHDFNLQNKRLSVRFRSQYSFSCLFDLSWYPFDSQTCIIEMELSELRKYVQFSYNIIEEDYTKNRKQKKLLTPPEFYLNYMKTVINCSSQPYWDSERFNCITYIFQLSRIRSQHITTTFLPSALTVILSWMSFWLNIDFIAPRMALGLACLLAVIIQFNFAQQHLPTVSVVKAIDVWMFSCLFMITASIIELGLAAYIPPTLLHKPRSATETPRAKPRRFLVGRKPKVCFEKMRISFSRSAFKYEFRSFLERQIQALKADSVEFSNYTD